MSDRIKEFDRLKKDCLDCIVLMRVGDFYESFRDDAEKLAKILGLTITRMTKAKDSVLMCGFPYHSLEGYLRKLVQSGVRVAICDQTTPSPGGLPGEGAE